jgi:hypothetical protein
MLLALAFLMTSVAKSATPADELLRYVPSDVGFCFIARDLRAHGEALADSPFVAELRKNRSGEALVRSEELARLTRLEEQVQKQLGLDWEKLRTDILGDGIVFAYRPGPPGKPDEEEGLILIRARGPKPIADLVNRINEIQKSSGEVKEVEARTHRGLSYFCRLERDKSPSYYCLRGPVLLLSGNEAILLRALDLEQSTPAAAEPAIAKQFRLLGADRAVLALWLNPRAFDAHVDAKAKAQAPEAPAMQIFERYWSALDGAAFYLDLAKDVSFSVAVRGRTDSLTPAAQRFFAEAARPSDLWQSFPERAMVAAAGRVNFAALVEIASEFIPTDGKPALNEQLNRTLGPPLGKNIVSDVLPCLGPDAGFCLYAPDAKDKKWCPKGFAAVRIAAGDSAAPVDQAVSAGIQTLAMLTVLGHNAKDPDHPLTLQTEIQDKRSVKYLTGEGVFPPGLQPAFGLHSGYLVIATSPDVLRTFSPQAAAAVPEGQPIPLFRLNLKQCREYLRQNQESLSTALAEAHALKPEDVRSRLDTVTSTLELFDRLEISKRSAAGKATYTVRLQTALPLQK